MVGFIRIQVINNNITQVLIQVIKNILILHNLLKRQVTS